MQVVAGGGAVESALSVYLEYLATTLGSREQLAIAEFAEALLIIPKVHFPVYLCLFFLFCYKLFVPSVCPSVHFPVKWLVMEIGVYLLLQVLSVNAAKDATELVAKLRAYHHTAQTKADKQHLSRYYSYVNIVTTDYSCTYFKRS